MMILIYISKSGISAVILFLVILITDTQTHAHAETNAHTHRPTAKNLIFRSGNLKTVNLSKTLFRKFNSKTVLSTIHG